MPKTTQLMVWVVVDEDGNYAVGRNGDEAAEAYRCLDDVEAEAGLVGVRRVKVTLTVPLPEPIQLVAFLPAADEPAATADVQAA